jgi:hypothetical protein
MHHCPNTGRIERLFLWRQPIDARQFVGQGYAIPDKIKLEVAYVSQSLSFFKARFAFFQVARQSLTFLLVAFAVGDIGDYAHVLKIAGVISSGMRHQIDVLDNTIG